MAATMMSHVCDCQNEVNDNIYNMKVAAEMKQQRAAAAAAAATVAAKKSKSGLLKPLLRLLKKKTNKAKYAKTAKTVVQEESYYSEEIDNQNNANEALERRLLAEMQAADEGAAITVCLDGQMTVVPVVPGQYYVPVHFAHTHAGDFYWTTLSLADCDLYYKERAFSSYQTPEMQVA